MESCTNCGHSQDQHAFLSPHDCLALHQNKDSAQLHSCKCARFQSEQEAMGKAPCGTPKCIEILISVNRLLSALLKSKVSDPVAWERVCSKEVATSLDCLSKKVNS